MLPDVEGTPEALNLEEPSDSLDVLNPDVSETEEAFFTRFKPAVVETFQTSWMMHNICATCSISIGA